MAGFDNEKHSQILFICVHLWKQILALPFLPGRGPNVGVCGRLRRPHTPTFGYFPVKFGRAQIFRRNSCPKPIGFPKKSKT